MTKLRVFDSHFHIMDPRFPLTENQGYLPEYFTVDDYLESMKMFTLEGGVVVSGSFQGFDQTFFYPALEKLGASFVGVTQLPATTPDDEILRLNQHRIKALRFNIKRCGSEVAKQLSSVAARIFEIAGWHVELYIDSTMLKDLYPVLSRLPKISIDHLGLRQTGFEYLLKLVDKGAHVKASGFGRVDFEVRTALKTIFSSNPGALMFGSDLPSTRAPRPFHYDDCMLILDCLGDTAADRVFYKNAVDFYNITEKPVYI